MEYGRAPLAGFTETKMVIPPTIPAVRGSSGLHGPSGPLETREHHRYLLRHCEYRRPAKRKAPPVGVAPRAAFDRIRAAVFIVVAAETTQMEQGVVVVVVVTPA